MLKLPGTFGWVENYAKTVVRRLVRTACVCIGKLLLETNKYLLLYVSRHAASGTKLITPPANPLGAHPRGGLGLGDASGLCDFSFAGSRTERQASAGTQTPSLRRRKRTSPERIFHFVPSCPNAILSVAQLDADAFLSFGAFPVADRLLLCTVAERLGDFASSHAAFKRRRGKKNNSSQALLFQKHFFPSFPDAALSGFIFGEFTALFGAEWNAPLREGGYCGQAKEKLV